jgi:CRP-like cAMP-binding protein
MGNKNEFVLNILKGLDIFSGIDANALGELSLLFEEKVFSEGETIFEEDSAGNSMMLITSGEVRVSQRADSNMEEALIILKTGEIFGEMALIDDLPRSATVIAHTNAIIFEINRSDFLNYIKKDSKNGILILLKLAKILSSRLREADNKLKAFINMSQWI